MRISRRLVFVALFVIAVVLLLGAYYYNQHYHRYIMSHKKMYCYDTFFGPPNSALMITDLGYGESLIKYYQLEEKGRTPVGNFPLLGLPTDTPVYVMGYVGKDSMLVDIVNYWDKGGKSRSSYLRGYVYSKTLHDKPASRKD